MQVIILVRHSISVQTDIVLNFLLNYDAIMRTFVFYAIPFLNCFLYLNFRTNQKVAILESNLGIKERSMNLLEEEYSLKIKYQQVQLQHQDIKHKLEMEILILEKKKKKIEIAKLRNNSF